MPLIAANLQPTEIEPHVIARDCIFKMRAMFDVIARIRFNLPLPDDHPLSADLRQLEQSLAPYGDLGTVLANNALENLEELAALVMPHEIEKELEN